MVVEVWSPGVVSGAAELVSRNTDVVPVPIVENCNWVVPLTVWNTLGFTPPEVLPVMRATPPVARAAPPNATPRPCEAAPPIRPAIWLPRPRLTSTLPKSERVDTRLKVMSPVRDESSVTSILLAPKLPAFRELILAELTKLVPALMVDAYMSLVEM